MAVTQHFAPYVKSGLNVLVNYATPCSDKVTLMGAVAFWYGHRVATTFAPGILANIAIAFAVKNLGSTTGTILGTTVVAPAIVPELLPKTIYFCATGFALIVIIIGNIVSDIFGWVKKTAVSNQKTPTALDPQKKV